MALTLLGGASLASPAQGRTDSDVGALWPDTFQAGQTAGDCGKWTLDANGFCVANDARNGLEVGVRFQTARTNEVIGVRFYRVDTAAMTASLWDADRNRVARQAIAPGPGNRWVNVHFPEPVTLEPGQVYTASYFTPGTKYAFRYDFFAAPMTVGPVTAPQSTPEDPNGVFCYDDSPRCDSFPARGYRSATYWLTPLWRALPGEPTSPPTSRPLTPPSNPGTPGSAEDGLGPAVTSMKKLRARFSEPVRARTLTRRTVRLTRGGKVVRARIAYNAGRRQLTLRPRKAVRGKYRVVVTTGVRDLAGNRLDQHPRKPGNQAARWSFRLR